MKTVTTFHWRATGLLIHLNLLMVSATLTLAPFLELCTYFSFLTRPLSLSLSQYTSFGLKPHELFISYSGPLYLYLALSAIQITTLFFLHFMCFNFVSLPPEKKRQKSKIRSNNLYIFPRNIATKITTKLTLLNTLFARSYAVLHVLFPHNDHNNPMG